MKNNLYYPHTFELELGGSLSELNISYHTYGKLSSSRDNVMWVFHALTANSDVEDWWAGLFGKENVIDPSKYFIICVNILGSCYGTTGAASIKPNTNQIYATDFPKITIRDMVKVHQIVQKELGISKIAIGIGGSMGGYQLQEWMITDTELFDKVILLATSPRESSWGKGIHTVYRRAIELDPEWGSNKLIDAKKGLSLARSIAMLFYRNFEIYENRQADADEVVNNFKVSSYLDYQGKKLTDRFDAYSFYSLTEAMDTHQLGRNREDIKLLFSKIPISCLVIGISSDLLCPPADQEFIAKHLQNAELVIIDSLFGHDGFLIEYKSIQEASFSFLNKSQL